MSGRRQSIVKVAGFACALAVFYANDALLDFVLTNSHTDDMVRQICIQAAATLGNGDYHEVSKHILLQMATNYDTELALFSRDFFKVKIDIRRDAEFLQQIVGSRSGSKNLYSFMKYLSETDEDITHFADMIKVIGDSLTGAHEDFRDRLIVEDLIQCVIRLFDRGKNAPQIKGICLDAWDVLFQNNLREIKPLADMLDNFD